MLKLRKLCKLLIFSLIFYVIVLILSNKNTNIQKSVYLISASEGDIVKFVPCYLNNNSKQALKCIYKDNEIYLPFNKFLKEKFDVSLILHLK